MIGKINSISYNTRKTLPFKSNQNTKSNDIDDKANKIANTVFHVGALSALGIATAVSNKNNKGFLKNMDNIGGPIVDVALYSGALLGGIITSKDTKTPDEEKSKNNGKALTLLGIGGLAGFAGKFTANIIKKSPNKFDKTWSYSYFGSLALVLPYLLKIIINDAKTRAQNKKEEKE